MEKSCCDEYCSTHGCNQGRNCPVRIERIRRAKDRLDNIEPIRWFIYRVVGIAIVSSVFVLAYVNVWGS